MYAEHWVQCLCALGKIISLTNIISPRATEMVSATDNSEREGSGISLSVCVCVCVYVQLLRCIQFFATTWAIAHQASLSMEFSMPRILEWVAISFSGGSSWPRDQTCVSCVSSTGRWILYRCAIWEAFITSMIHPKYTFPFWSLCIIIILRKPNLLPSQLNWN